MDKKNNIFKSVFRSRSLKYGSNSIILVVAVVFIAVLINLLVGMADLKVDLTSNKLFSLSDTTKNMMKDLKQDVTIIGLFDDGKITSGDEYKEVTELLGLYRKYNHVKVQYVDPDKNPGVIKQLDEDNTMELQKNDFVVKSVINGKEKKKKLGYYDLFQTQMDEQTFQTYKIGSNAEQGFTGAIKYVVSEKTPVVYFTQGHNEMDVDGSLKNIKDYLEKNNYLVKTLNLATTKKITADAEIIVVASPKSDLTSAEKVVLSEYLKNGGKAVFMFDYLTNDPDFTQFNSLLGNFNVGIDYDKVKENDTSRHLPDNQYTILMNVSSNSIIPEAFSVILSNSRSIRILKNLKEYIIPTSLMVTADTAVGEPASASRGENLQGPLDIAVAVQNKGGAVESKIIVLGNASFISDNAAQAYGSMYNNNIVFFIQSINWMLGNKEEIIVPTKTYDVKQINVSQLQANVLGVVLIIILPLIILSTGLFVYLRRRHL